MLNSGDEVLDGLILAGGQSARMGRDKAGLLVGEKTLLQHQVACMRPVVGRLWVAGGEADLPADVMFLNDVLAGKQGPLSGILSGLQATSADFLWLMPCDSFGFGADLADRLLQALHNSGADIAYIASGEQLHPLLAVLRKTVCNDLQYFLSGNGRSVLRFYAGQSTVRVNWQAAPGHFFNVNTPEDYQELLESVC